MDLLDVLEPHVLGRPADGRDVVRGPHVVARRTCRRTGRDGWYLWWT